MRNDLVWRYAVACAVVMAAAGAGGQAAVKQAVPAPAAQKEALAGAKNGTQKSVVGNMMYEAAKVEKGSVEKYVLLSRAKDLFTEGANVQGAFGAIDELAGLYDVKGYKLKAEAVALINKNGWHNEQRWRVVMAMPGVIVEAIMAEDFEAARQLAAAEMFAARLTQDADAIKEATARGIQIRDAENACGEAKKAAATIEKTPEDADANLKFGKYVCFYLGDWKSGLPMLAKGSDAALKAAVELEKESDKIKLGDKWWEIAAAYTGVAKANIMDRAAKMYADGVGTMEPGLGRSRVESRMEEVKKAASRQASDAPWEKPFVGEYQISNGLLTINADHSAKNTWGSTTGTWTYVEGAIQIRWQNGWMDVIHVQGNSITNIGFRPGQTVTDPPFGKGSGVRRRPAGQ